MRAKPSRAGRANQNLDPKGGRGERGTLYSRWSAVRCRICPLHPRHPAERDKASESIVAHLGELGYHHSCRNVLQGYGQWPNPWCRSRCVGGRCACSEVRNTGLDEARQVLSRRRRSRNRALASLQRSDLRNRDELERGVPRLHSDVHVGVERPKSREQVGVDNLLGFVRVRDDRNPALDSGRRRPTDHVLRGRDHHDVHPVRSPSSTSYNRKETTDGPEATCQNPENGPEVLATEKADVGSQSACLCLALVELLIARRQLKAPVVATSPRGALFIFTKNFSSKISISQN